MTSLFVVLCLLMQGGAVMNVRGMVQNIQGRVSNYGGVVGNAFGEVFNASGACKNVGGKVQNVEGFVVTHGGTVLNTPTAAKNPPAAPKLSPLSAAVTPVAANPLAAYQVPRSLNSNRTSTLSCIKCLSRACNHALAFFVCLSACTCVQVRQDTDCSCYVSRLIWGMHPRSGHCLKR